MLTKALRLIGLVPASYVDAAVTEHVRQEAILQEIITKADVRYSKLMTEANTVGFDLDAMRLEAQQATSRAEGLETKLATVRACAPRVGFSVAKLEKTVDVYANFYKGSTSYSTVLVARRIRNKKNEAEMYFLADALQGAWNGANANPG